MNKHQRYRANHPALIKERSKEYRKRYYAKNKEKIDAQNKAHYLKNKQPYLKRAKERLRIARYGVTPAQYLAMLVAQNGLCAICGQPETKVINSKVIELAVDHDHVTGKVRALLCHGCNAAIGLFHENTDTMVAAINYINQYAEGEIHGHG